MKPFLFVLFFFLMQHTTVSGQWYDPSKVKSKVQEKYNQALDEVKNNQYDHAILLLDACLKQDPRFIDALLSKAGIYSQKKRYPLSVSFYEQAIKMDSQYTKSFLLPYSIALGGNGQFQEALNAVTQYLLLPTLHDRSRKAALYRKKSYEFALTQKDRNKNSNYQFTPINLGDSINSVFSEYFPCMTIDQQQLVFTRRVNNRNEDFYISNKNNTAWSKAHPLPGELNTALNEGAQTMSQDGQILFFTGCNMNDGIGRCDLYVSYLMKNGWSKQLNLGSPVNTQYWESQPALSPDKKILYFTSYQPDGFGGSDLYYSELQSNGKWSAPKNMGAEINTAGDESSPFIHADNESFYFTSNGLPGYGGTDLYLCRKQEDGSWGKPENLGYPINTIDDEGTLFISSNGTTAFFASDGLDSRGGLDLFTFELPREAQPLKTIWIKGAVYDRDTKAGLPSTVELKDVDSKRTICNIQTQDDGTYLIPLPLGKKYAFHVNRKGYLFYSETFAMKEKTTDSGFTVMIPLIPIEKNATIELKNIFYHTGKSDLDTASFTELDKVVQLLTENSTLKVEIIGHTDNVGKAADNLSLSNQRASSVVNYLVYKGIAENRLSAKGMGASQPIASNEDENGRAQNRRTELKVLSF
jgi:outer membrane protein OmpA-like peptidoglycan-associated protein/tetratricopeptide (TPR) repeat protein